MVISLATPLKRRDNVPNPLRAVAGSLLLILLNCASALAKEPEARGHEQIVIQTGEQARGIDIDSYTLITNDPERDRLDAADIMRVKAAWPRAMQTKDKALFESILARDFTFRAEDEWYERDAYIRNRVESHERVMAVRYENLVLQSFGQLAVLTYRNVVKHTDATGKPDTLHLSWADIFVREQGTWRIRASHLISLRVENGK